MIASSRQEIGANSRLAPSLTIAAMIGAALGGDAIGLTPGALIVVLMVTSFGAVRLVDVLFRARRPVDVVLTAFTVGAAWFMVVAEVLSRLHALGSRPAWIVGLCALGLLGATVDPAASRPCSIRLELPARAAGRLALLASVVCGCLVWGNLAVLVPLTGILNPDQHLFYMPRAVRYLQDGTFERYSTVFDYFPRFNEAMTLLLLLFTGSDSYVLLLPVVFGVVVALTIYAYASRLGSRSFGVVATLPLLGVPMVIYGTSFLNTTLVVAAWLTLALYFLTRAYALTDRRWLCLAAAAIGLAIATKPTAWFAMPGLGLLGVLLVVRAIRRGRGRALRVTIPLCLAIGILVGGIYLISNLVLRGFLATPPDSIVRPADVLGVAQYLQRIAFYGFIMSAFVLVPPSIVPSGYQSLFVLNIGTVGQWLGFGLPSEYLTFPPRIPWEATYPFFHPAWAGQSLGLVIPLVVLPSTIRAVARASVRDRRWLALVAPSIVAVGYFATFATVLGYYPSQMRYLVEPALILMLVGPLILYAPWERRIGWGRVLVASIIVMAILWELRLVVGSALHLDVELLASIPREEQYARFNNEYRYKFFSAPRRLDQRYPPTEYPEIALQVPNLATPQFFQYPFLTDNPQRRFSYWQVTPETVQVRPSVPVLTPFAELAQSFRGRPGVFVDTLAPGLWLIVPLDRMAITWREADPGDARFPAIRVDVHVDLEKYREAQFRFGVARSADDLKWSGDSDWSSDSHVLLSLDPWIRQPSSSDAHVDPDDRLFVEVRSLSDPAISERRSVSLTRLTYGWDAR